MACHSCAKDFERAIEKKIHQLRRHGREVQS
jgi:biotin operon repressor